MPVSTPAAKTRKRSEVPAEIPVGLLKKQKASGVLPNYKGKPAPCYRCERDCEGKFKGSGLPCDHKASYWNKKTGQVFCGTHTGVRCCPREGWIVGHLKANPQLKIDADAAGLAHAASVANARAENIQADPPLVGQVTMCKQQFRQAVTKIPGYLMVHPNFGAGGNPEHGNLALNSLSPMLLGPVVHREMGVPNSKTLEAYHQQSKIYSHEVNVNLVPIPPTQEEEEEKRAAEGPNPGAPIRFVNQWDAVPTTETMAARSAAFAGGDHARHKYTKNQLRTLGSTEQAKSAREMSYRADGRFCGRDLSGDRDLSTSAEKYTRPLGSVHVSMDDPDALLGFDYLETRVMYCQAYYELSKDTPQYTQLLQLVKGGTNVCIVGYDGFKPTTTAWEHFNDTSRPYGHEAVLGEMLEADLLAFASEGRQPKRQDSSGDDEKERTVRPEFSWERYRRENKEVFNGITTKFT